MPRTALCNGVFRHSFWNGLRDMALMYHDGRGCEIVWFDKKSRAKLAKAVGKQVVDRLGPLLDAYAVMTSAGVFITTGWLQQRILVKG